MSVHQIDRASGSPAHTVRWRSPDGANCARTFEDAADAASFDAAMKARLAYDRAKVAWEAIPERWRLATDEEL